MNHPLDFTLVYGYDFYIFFFYYRGYSSSYNILLYYHNNIHVIFRKKKTNYNFIVPIYLLLFTLHEYVVI